MKSRKARDAFSIMKGGEVFVDGGNGLALGKRGPRFRSIGGARRIAPTIMNVLTTVIR